MPTTQTPHRTPLKRVSQGSLFALSRSAAYPDAPHGLGFLEPAMSEFVDETEALQANIEGMKNLSDSLTKFNESFASWLYIMNMNALTVDWPQAPADASFLMAKQRAERDALNAIEAIKASKREADAADRTAMTEVTDVEVTFSENVTTNTSTQTSKSATAPKKKPGKAKLSAKEKKERSLEIEKVISCLPLEFRGSDPNLRRSMETVIEGLMNVVPQGIKLIDLIKPPDLIQARVNKCLIALVNRKVVRKDNSTGTALQEQKRRRAERFESTRNLDTFADLTLGISDDENDVDADEFIPAPPSGSIAQYAPMLLQPVDPLSITTHVKPIQLSPHPESNIELSPPEAASTSSTKSSPLPAKKHKKKRKGKSKPNKWADGCMYAELLEMVDDPSEAWTGDGLPADLENGWVALAPVPQGKRCLAVTQAAVGAPSHATLRSRLLGKVLLNRFPSTLPPHTVLDCVLDTRWKENGVLHVLDVIKWKGQDISDCETAFRFWWRDTRLGELPFSGPPPKAADSMTSAYTFPYPITLLPVPYHIDTTIPSFLTHIVPSVRIPRSVGILAPTPTSEGMDVDSSLGAVQWTNVTIEPDGMLLYVKAASYEAGTSPLSSWVPIISYDGLESPLDLFERLVRRRVTCTSGNVGEVSGADVEMEL
ncbi:hypothetical protein C0991_007467 [Blastosporella zonata]|nr:hypothetical protein C0991_007467 [Blastosporella zonata]